MDRVEGVEKLLLRPFLAGDELDVVDEEHVDPAIAFPEVLALLRADRVDELVRELLARGIRDALFGMPRDDGMADRVHEMRLAEAGPAVHEEWVVAVAGPLGHGKSRGVREPVIRADDEGRKGVALVEHRADGCLATFLGARLLGERRRGRRSGPHAAVRGRDEADVDCPPEEVLKGRADLRTELVLEPLARERVRHPDEEDIVLFRKDLRVFEPGVVRRARKADLQLTEGRSPDLLEVQRLPFSLLVHAAPHMQ